MVKKLDYIYVIWKDPETGKRYNIGELSKNGKYEFLYNHSIKEAINAGFKLILPFNNIEEKYSSDVLFPAFRTRIPDKRRKDIKNILARYGLTEYNEYELLKKSGGKLPIDNIEFINPIIIENNENPIIRKFYIAGSRHYLNCMGKNCHNISQLNIGEKLRLVPEPTNNYDKHAVQIKTKTNLLIGYIPKYYSAELTELLKMNSTYNFEILEINKNNNCDECIKVKLNLYK